MCLSVLMAVCILAGLFFGRFRFGRLGWILRVVVMLLVVFWIVCCGFA